MPSVACYIFSESSDDFRHLTEVNIAPTTWIFILKILLLLVSLVVVDYRKLHISTVFWQVRTLL